MAYVNIIPLYYVASHVQRCEIVWSLSRLWCTVCKSVLSDCRERSALFYIAHLDKVATSRKPQVEPRRYYVSMLLRTVMFRGTR